MIKLIKLLELNINNSRSYKLCDWVNQDSVVDADWDTLKEEFGEDTADAIVIATGELDLVGKPFTKKDIELQSKKMDDFNDMWGGTIDELITYLLKHNIICQ